MQVLAIGKTGQNWKLIISLNILSDWSTLDVTFSVASYFKDLARTIIP